MSANRQPTILVVEDSPKIRPLIVRILESAGYRALIASGAEEAQQVMETAGDVDLVITDLILPGASGMELAQRLSERHPKVRVLHMSGLALDVGDGREFIAKPFGPEELIAKVKKLLA